MSLGAKLKISKLKAVRDWFYRNNAADFGNPYENVVRSSLIPKDFAESKSVRDKVVSYFSSFDPSIIGVEVEEDDKEKGTVKINAMHRINGGGVVSIPLMDESAGTLKMFALYPSLLDTLENGGVLFVDELNSRLHPLLVRAILVTFLNPEININNAQIVFTTHDTWQLANHLLRRDEVWFAEKADDGATTLFSLVDFVDDNGEKIRKDESYEKNYLLGKYGAVPDIKGFDLLEGHEDGLEKGREQGIEQGIEQGMKMSAIRMRESGMKTKDISYVLQTDEKKVREWIGEDERSKKRTEQDAR